MWEEKTYDCYMESSSSHHHFFHRDNNGSKLRNVAVEIQDAQTAPLSKEKTILSYYISTHNHPQNTWFELNRVTGHTSE